jgi:DHA2 family methylenomycin A resistance protein-like MFS transporter
MKSSLMPEQKSSPAGTSPDDRDPVRAKYALYAICFGFFLVLLDTTALNVAIAAMEHEFGGVISGLQWVVNSYTLVFASLLLVCGATGDRFGARLLYQGGLLLFTGTSLLCALSPGINFLIGMRILQGLGAAMMLPASLSLLSHAFPKPEERAHAVAFWASMVSLGFAAGPVLGGLLTSCFGWRSIFWINVPVGILALTMVRRFVTEARVPNPRHIDWAGQFMLSLALFCLTYALIQAGKAGWGAPSIVTAFALAILFAILFVLIERRSSFPVMPGNLFSKPAFSICVLIGLVLNFSMYGILFVESLYLQNVRHLSALAAGLIILPFTGLPTITTRLIGNRNGGSHIKPRLIIGQLIAVVGAATLGFECWATGYWPILLGFGLLGVAMGFIMPAMTAGVLISAPTHMSGLASGILNSSRQVGGVLGVALMGTFMQRLQTQGLLISFGLTLLSFLLMTAATSRFIRQRD